MSLSTRLTSSIRALIHAAAGSPTDLIPLLDNLIGPLLTERIETARAILKAHPDLLELVGGHSAATAVVWGEDFLFVAKSDRPVDIVINDEDPVPMRGMPGTNYWTHFTRLPLGDTHSYSIMIDGKLEGFQPSSVAGYHSLSYPIEGAPAGTLSERRTITSKVYDGAEARYWVYVNAGIDTDRGAPVMVWLDGGACIGSADAFGLRMQTVTDNLVYRGDIPPMVHILLNPSTGGTRQSEATTDVEAALDMRSLQFDEVTDEFGRYLVEEVLPDVGTTLRLRQDGYSRAIAGQSSGGICAFKVGWFEPNQFSRIQSSVGSFTALGWQPERGIDGGHLFPFLIRREPRKNLRVWLSDGANDFELDSNFFKYFKRIHQGGSWPLANLQMAQALKTSGYDFHFRFGKAHHDDAQGALDLPESLAWLWRNYDPRHTAQSFEQDPIEQAKPVYRVGVVNRDAW